jgi:hypothetical protein
MRHPFFILIVVVLLSNMNAPAQGIWLRSDKYFYNPGEKATVSLQTGNDFISKPFPCNKEDVEVLEISWKTTSTDIRRFFVEGEKPSFTFDVPGEGIITYSFRGKPIREARTKEQFTEYAKNLGLNESAGGEKTISGLKGDSIYVLNHYHVKGYVRGGKQLEDRKEEPEGLHIEVIPDKNPLGLRRGDKITFTVYKEGKPAFGVRVQIWNRWNNRTTIQHIYTQKDGTVSTMVSSPGDWMVTVATLENPATDSGYVVNTFNLMFGYR